MSSINMELQHVLDTLAPEQEKRVSLKAKQPWYDKEMAGLKHKVWKLKKKWTKYKLDACWQAYKKARNSYYYLLNSKKKESIRSKIQECSTDSHQLHRLTNNLTKPQEEQQWPKHDNPESLANEFADYFETKILNIRKTLEDTPPYQSM